MSRVMTAMNPPQIEGRLSWSYPQEVNGRTHWIQSSGYETLINDLTDYRISNQITLGNPENDIEDYFCRTFPANCNRQVTPEAMPATAPKSFRERVTQWAANRYQYAGSINLVEQEVADKRAQICSQCPANKNWRIGCQPCVASTDRTLVLIRQNRKPALAVLGCSITGQDNTAAVLLPEEMLRHRNRYLDELPTHCWLKSL